MSEEIKIEIGKRIREERERQGLTREHVCDTEEELTVKQLMRIELGRSLPTIVKLQYISDKLGVSLNYLLGETKLDIPEEYYQAKLEYEKLEQKENRILKTLIQYYNEYIVNSSFPYTLQLDSDLKNIHEYLSGIYNSVLLKDIVARLKISDVMRLESVVKYIFDNIGNLTSLSKIANTLTSMGRKTDAKTIEKYIRGLTDSLLVHEVSRYNIKGKEFLSTLSKYYVADLGLRQMILGNRNIDMGHILENIIYLELLRRKGNVYVGQFDKNEIDFVIVNSNEIEYYQVALTVLDENTLKRELDAFKNIKDNYPKYLITLDDVMVNTDYDGIKVVNALEWLLGGKK